MGGLTGSGRSGFSRRLFLQFDSADDLSRLNTLFLFLLLFRDSVRCGSSLFRLRGGFPFDRTGVSSTLFRGFRS